MAIGLIEQEAAAFGGDVSKIILGGFSQGAMIGYGTLLRMHTKFDKPLAGVVCLSGIVPCHPQQDGLLTEGM